VKLDLPGDGPRKAGQKTIWRGDRYSTERSTSRGLTSLSPGFTLPVFVLIDRRPVDRACSRST
jgi:hypothetical protein